MKASIEKVKTWHGLRYAVVAPFTTQYYEEIVNKEDLLKKGTKKDKDSKNKKKKMVLKSRTNNFAVEYKQGDRIRVAEFPCNEEGLKQAKDVLKSFV